MLKINSNSVIRAAFGAVMYTFINYFVCEISCVIRTPAGTPLVLPCLPAAGCFVTQFSHGLGPAVANCIRALHIVILEIFLCSQTFGKNCHLRDFRRSLFLQS